MQLSPRAAVAMGFNRKQVTDAVTAGLRRDHNRLRSEFLSGPEGIRSCVLDNVLPQSMMDEISAHVPDPSVMLRKADYRERKYVTAELSQLHASLGELVLGIASAGVAEVISEMVGLDGLEHDRELYNGGVTAMVPQDYMVPHLDNSHDKSRSRRRAVVVLFYLADWGEQSGGALALWDKRQKNVIKNIEYKPNRLVILETTEESWHSVQPITGPETRYNVTTYFYEPAASKAYPVRLTRYSGWPDQPRARAMAQADFFIRTAALKMGLDRFVKKRHALSQPVSL